MDDPIMTSRIVLTYEDYAALPDDGKRYELHEGELSVTPAPGTRHQQVLLNLALTLGPHVRARTSGELFILSVICPAAGSAAVRPQPTRNEMLVKRRDVIRQDGRG